MIINTESEQPLLLIKDLKKYFPQSSGFFSREKQFVKAIDGVNFHVEKGETLGIVGESGCGKSTTGNTILRLIEATEGEIVFEGQNILQLSEKEMQRVRKDIQMVFQDPFSSLNPRLRVFDIIAEPFKTHHVAKGKKLRSLVYELMEIVGLDQSYADRFPHEFSGGQRQRIGIARALALKPKLIVCDEPVSALDVSIQAQILNLLMELQKKFNLTYIFIAHGIPAVKYISDRIAVMYMGEIVELADKELLFLETMHPYTRLLIDSVPNPNPNVKKVANKELFKEEWDEVDTNLGGCRFYSRCPYGKEICKEQRPKLVEKKNKQYVACHFPLSK